MSGETRQHLIKICIALINCVNNDDMENARDQLKSLSWWLEKVPDEV